MKMRKRIEPTTEDNRETMEEVRRQMSKICENIATPLEAGDLIDFICEVLEAKEAEIQRVNKIAVDAMKDLANLNAAAPQAAYSSEFHVKEFLSP